MRRIIREVDPPRPSARVSTLQAADLSTISDRRHVEPRKLSQQLRGELDWIVMKALDKDRDRRYESANALAADVERYLDDEPVQARPPIAGPPCGEVGSTPSAAGLVFGGRVGHCRRGRWGLVLDQLSADHTVGTRCRRALGGGHRVPRFGKLHRSRS